MAAAFSVEEIAEIERRINVHVGVQSAQFGGILESGAAQVEEALRAASVFSPRSSEGSSKAVSSLQSTMLSFTAAPTGSALSSPQ